MKGVFVYVVFGRDNTPDFSAITARIATIEPVYPMNEMSRWVQTAPPRYVPVPIPRL